jgi:O-antigen biosynthesis protein
MRYVRGEWIDNDELRRYYSAADIVLADHWEDMRDEGFIANRVFDALASGAFVVSDRVRDMDHVLDGGVATFGDPGEVPPLVERYLADPDARRELAARGRAAVLARHTFDHRAAAIIAEIDRLRGASRA